MGRTQDMGQQMGRSSKKFTFPGAQGQELAARLDMPDGTPKAFVLFAHCFTCSKDIFAAARIAGALADRGFGVLRFDFTGLGASDGEFANTNFSSNIEDLIAAARHLRKTHRAPAILVGHSLGGAAVLGAAAALPEVKAIATIGAPFDAAHVVQNFSAKLNEIESQGVAEVSLAGRRFTIKKQFLDDVSQHDMSGRIGNLHKALLVFHAPRDSVVGIENAGEIFKAARHPKSFVSLDDADHLLSRHADAVYVADVLSAWAQRYIVLEESDVEQPVAARSAATSATAAAAASVAAARSAGAPSVASAAAAAQAGMTPLPPGVVRASETGRGKFQQDVLVDDHRLLADEPESYGGMASGPSPYDFLGIALAACTSMTIRMYAARKGMALQHVAVDVSHKKIHAIDCDDCGADREGRVDRFLRQLSIKGELSDDERTRLTEIANRCPVHQTLMKSSAIVTKLL